MDKLKFHFNDHIIWTSFPGTHDLRHDNKSDTANNYERLRVSIHFFITKTQVHVSIYFVVTIR